tara:strand:- start:968 stop:2290 length:1323 start_codon:yes stop_codon:yes gene_type:complete
MNQTTPPHNQEAEERLIASCLLPGDSSVLDDVSNIIREQDFYTARGRFLFSAIRDLADAGKPLDEVHLYEALKGSRTLDEIGGVVGLHSIMDGASTASQAKHYANLIAEKSKLRQLIRHCRIALEQAEDESEFQSIRAELENNVLDIDSVNDSGFGVSSTMDEILVDVDHMIAGDYVPQVVKTNVGRLDEFLGNKGIAAGEVLTLAAPTSCGKSALALYISAKTMTEQETPIAYFSFEMPQKQLMKRMVQSLSGVNQQRIQQRIATPEEIERYRECTEKARGLPLSTVHSVHSVEDLASKARYLVRKKGVKLVVIDYLQLVGFNARDMSKAEGIAHISHKIKQMALDLNISVILLAQVNREGAKRETGLSLYDLKDSGDIENDADIVMLMWPHQGDVESSKDSDYRGPYTGLSYKLAKNREGERDIGDYLKFYHCTGRFI